MDCTNTNRNVHGRRGGGRGGAHETRYCGAGGCRSARVALILTHAHVDPRCQAWRDPRCRSSGVLQADGRAERQGARQREPVQLQFFSVRGARVRVQAGQRVGRGRGIRPGHQPHFRGQLAPSAARRQWEHGSQDRDVRHLEQRPEQRRRASGLRLRICNVVRKPSTPAPLQTIDRWTCCCVVDGTAVSYCAACLSQVQDCVQLAARSGVRRCQGATSLGRRGQCQHTKHLHERKAADSRG